jgi:hypothetical protein
MIRSMTPLAVCLLALAIPGICRGDDVVRLIYLVPTDRDFRKDYEGAIWRTVVDVQTWYYAHMNGRTFRIKDGKIERLRARHDARWLSEHVPRNRDPFFRTVGNAVDEVTSISGPRKPNETWLIYVDAEGGTGAGFEGACVMVEHDLVGLTKGHNIGGSAHEMGHAFGLPHAVDQEANALMRQGADGGFTRFPACYLTASDTAKLSKSRFFVRGKPATIPGIMLLYDGGCFVELDSGRKWQEWKTGGEVLRFKQVDRTADTAVIVDPSRGVYLRLPLGPGWSYFSVNNTTGWRRLYELR